MRWFGLGIITLLTACTPSVIQDATLVNTPSPLPQIVTTIEPTPLPGNLDSVTFIDDGTSYTIQQLLPRDGIRPIYEPQFVSADNAPYADDELVMGVEINGDARAYAVGILQHREMIDDVVGGVPILATW